MTGKVSANDGGSNSNVILADTFMASAHKLATSDQGRVFDFVFKFRNNPANPGISLERVRNAGGKTWSARITRGLRAIVYRSGSQNILLFAGQHDEAYHWAERRRIEHHPVTHVLQIVETTEKVEQFLAEASHPSAEQQPLAIFSEYEDDYLISLGLPQNWLPAIRRIRSEDEVLTAAQSLPEEVGERLIALAGGEFVTPPPPASPAAPLADHPDNLRRFWVVRDAVELGEVLNRPWADWVKFLHPSQRELVEAEYAGPVKVTGAAGTGKTVVALHRARHLAEAGCSVFLTTYVSTLCRNLKQGLKSLCSEETLSRIAVETVHHRALELAQQLQPELRPLETKEFRELIEELKPAALADVSAESLASEWSDVVEPLGITTREEYQSALQDGRSTRLSMAERKNCWPVFESVRREMEKRSAYPWEQICEMARSGLASGQLENPFDAVIVDELQDLAPGALRLLAELARSAPGNFFLVGDAGQRIYPGGFSLKELGIDVRERSHVLRINYRTTEQIRRFADQLLPEAVDDLDDDVYQRRSHGLMNGPPPGIAGFSTPGEEDQFVAMEVEKRLTEGLAPSEIAVFARTAKRLESIRDVLSEQGVSTHLLSREESPANEDAVRAGTMHRAKGLEFKVVFATGCSQDALPHPKAIAEPKSREEAIARERQLLYVTITRARDEAFLTWSGERSPFLDVLES